MAIETPAVKRPRDHYTLVCQKCQKVIMKTMNRNFARPVRYSECRICAPAKGWNHHDAPMETP
jgi:hypothetical protein